VSQHLHKIFPIKNVLKQEDNPPPFLFIFVLEYAFRRVQVNQDGWELNVTHQVLFYADGINISVGSVHTMKKYTEALLAASKESRLEVNADMTKYMVMSRDKNAERNHRIKIGNIAVERMEQFKYLATTLKNDNSIQGEIKRRLK